MYFRQLRLPDIGCASYIVGSEGVCAVIDPRWDAVPHYMGLARQQGLRITHIIETHTHADHVSGATRLAARTGVPVLFHSTAKIDFAHTHMHDGDEVMLGTVRITVLHTPGHSHDSISLLIQDTNEPAPLRLLSGDTLFVGEVGRPDLHGTQAAQLAELLHESLYGRLLHLDDAVEVYPAHLAGSLCGRRIAPAPSTTIGHERQSNPMLAFADRATFMHSVITDLPPRPPNVEQILHLNRTGAPLNRPGAAHITPAEAAPMLPDVMVIDGRDIDAFAREHLRGAINIPISYGQFGVMAAWIVPPTQPLLLIASDEEDLTDAIDSLMVVGMTNPLSTVTATPTAWNIAGLPVVAMQFIQVTELISLLATGEIGTLVDVREAGEMEKGTITGAINLPYRTIPDAKNIPNLEEPVAVFCNSGNRSSMAASLLERRGISVINIQGGTSAWTDAGFPLVQPVSIP